MNPQDLAELNHREECFRAICERDAESHIEKKGGSITLSELIEYLEKTGGVIRNYDPLVPLM